MSGSTESGRLAAKLGSALGGSRLFAAALLFLIVIPIAPSHAAEIVDLRVGAHPEFTRVVFELDRPSSYKIERASLESGVSELVVSIDAASKVRSLKPKGGPIDAIRVSPAGKSSIARIQLGSGKLKLKEMVLANPDRIVIDVLAPALASEARTAPPVARRNKPEPPLARKNPIRPAPTPGAGLSAKSVPAPRAVQRGPEPVIKIAKSTSEPVGSTSPSTQPEIIGGSREKVSSTLAAASRASRAGELAPLPPVAAAHVAESEDSPFPHRTLAITGLLLVVAALTVAGLRRRGSGTVPSAVAIENNTMTDSPERNPFADPDSGSGAQLVFQAEDEAGDSFEEGQSGDDTADEGEADAWDEEAPSLETAHSSETSVVGDESASDPLQEAATGVDVRELIEGLEEQIADLEDRLEEVVHARDRLERQMTAQNEELRVQRSAIARTQRTVRNMNRTEGDATEDPVEWSDES